MRVRRATKSDHAVAPMPSLTAKGSVRSPGEREALTVTLTIAGTEVALRSADLELGTWQTSDVEISAVDATRFTFIAEGDRLIFTADDPMGFASHPLVRPYPGSRVEEDSQPKRQRKRKRKRKRSEPTAAPSEELAAIQSEDSTAMEPGPDDGLDTSTDIVLDAISTEPEEVPTPDAVAIPTEIEVQAGPDATAVGPIDDDPFDDSPPHEDSVERRVDSGTRNGPWIRTLDVARRNGLFGLDRVQVAEGLRGQEHQHTFDHGAAAGYGPSKHVCTICGKVRFRP
jgi:hypothetical protein